MVALTYGDTRVSGVETKTATKTAPNTVVAARPGFFARFMAAMMEARMRQAERELRLFQNMNVVPVDAVADERATTETPRGGW